MLLIFATRPSALARWQTQYVIQAMKEDWPGLDCVEVIISTSGDRILDRPLPEIGGKGLFTQELESELLSGRVHAAVHSLKDLPVDPVPGLSVSALPQRGEARDVLISARGYSLETLPEGACVGTSSLRRSAQLLAQRPDLQALPLRGNVDTRLRKALEGQYDAIVLAGAGISRLGLGEHITQWLPLEVMLPAPGQGALAVQSRSEDQEALHYLSALDDRDTRLAVTAERAFLSGLGGGCSLPVAAYAHLDGETIQLQGLVASTNGKQVIRASGNGIDPLVLGADLAEQALGMGAQELLHGEPA